MATQELETLTADHAQLQDEHKNALDTIQRLVDENKAS